MQSEYGEEEEEEEAEEDDEDEKENGEGDEKDNQGDAGEGNEGTEKEVQENQGTELKDNQEIKEEEEIGNKQEIEEAERVGDAFETIHNNFEALEIIDPKKEYDSCLEIPVKEEEDELVEMISHDWAPMGRSKGATGSVSSMSTIHPDVIKKQVKKNFTRQKNQEIAKRIRAKGEASAVTRKRRENSEAVRPGGIWGWDN